MADGKIIIETDLDKTGIEKSLGQLGSIASKGSKVAIGAIAGVTTAVGGVATASIKVGMDFESSMSQVAATMGITSQEISSGSKSFEMLKQAAKDAGASTQFSASESAEALNYLALAGYDAEKSVKALPTVLNLAAAGGIELGYASDLVTDSMSALGLSTDELEGFVDKLAKTSQKSNTNIAQLGEAILTVGGTAKVLSGGTTELNTALGILADNGVKGAEGGTALRNVILSLSAPTDQARDKMKELGLEVFDAQGNMRPLNDIFNDLNGILGNMSQGEQTQVLSKLFNKVDLKSVNALLANSGDRFNELSGYINNADGAAAQMAKTMNDNLKGRLKELGSALEGVGIQIYEKLEGPLKDAAEIAIENIGKLSDSISNGNLSDSIEKMGEAIGKFIELLSDLISITLPALINAFTWLVDHGNTISTMFVSATAAVAAFKAVSVIKGVIDAWKTAKSVAVAYNLAIAASSSAELLLASTMSAREVIVAVLTGNMTLATGATTLWTMATSALSTAMTFLGGPIGLIVIAIAALAAGIIYLWNTNDGFRDAILKAWDKICKFFTDTIPAAFNTVIDFVKNNWQGLLLFIVNPFIGAFKLLYDNCESFRNFINNIWDKILDKIHEWGENIRSFFNETIPGWIESFKEWWNGLPEYFAQLWESVKAKFIEWGTNISNFFTETIPGWIESIRAWFNELPYKIGEALGFVLGAIYQWGVNTYNYFATNIPLWIESVSTWFSEMPGKVWTWLCDCINKIYEWGMNVYNSFSASVTSTVEAVSTWFSEMPGKVWNWLNDCINKIKDWGSQTYNNAKDAAQRTIDSVSQWFSQLPGKVWNWLSNVIEKVRQWGSDMVEKGRKAASDTVNKVVDGFKDLPNKIKQKGKDVVEGLWNGIVGMKDWLWGKITGFCGGIVDGFKKALRINSPSKIMRDKIGVGIVEGIDVGIDKEMPNLDKNIDYNMNEMTSKMQRAITSEQVNVASTFSLKGNYEVNQNNNDTEIVSILTSIMKDIKNIDPKIFLDSKELILSKIEMIKDGLNDSEQRNPKFI